MEASSDASRPGRHAEQRQDLAVQRADRQPAEGRELSGRHRRAQGRRVRDAAGPSASTLVDLPGTYSLRGRSPDEEITRDVVLGRLAGEAAARPRAVRRRRHQPAADASACVLELKSIGRPMLLVLNMIDIATPPRHHRSTSTSCRQSSACRSSPRSRCASGGTADLLRRTDELAGAGRRPTPRENLWQPLDASSELRATQREADRIIAAAVSLPARPDTWTGADRCGACCIRSPGSRSCCSSCS